MGEKEKTAAFEDVGKKPVDRLGGIVEDISAEKIPPRRDQPLLSALRKNWIRLHVWVEN